MGCQVLAPYRLFLDLQKGRNYLNLYYLDGPYSLFADAFLRSRSTLIGQNCQPLIHYRDATCACEAWFFHYV